MNRRRRFAGKINMYFGILIAIIFLVFGIIICNTVANENTMNAIENQCEMCSVISENVHEYFREMDAISNSIAENDSLMDDFMQLSSSDMSNFYDFNTSKRIDAYTLLRTAVLNSVADRICIFNSRNDFVFGGIDNARPESVKDSLKRRIDINTIFGEMISNSTNIFIPITHEDWWDSYNDGRYVSMMRPFHTKHTPIYRAVIDVETDASKIEDLITLNESNRIKSFLYSADGYLIASSDYQNIESDYINEIYDETSDALANDEKWLFSDKYKEYIAAKTINDYGLRLVMVRTKADVFRLYSRTLFIVIGVCVVAFLILLLIIKYLSDRLCEPLLKLSNTIEKVSMDNLEMENIQNMPSEVQQVYNSFSEVLDNLDRSITLEMKAQLDIMQNQINSHFLYNMLAVINALASEGNTKTVNLMTSKLSEMLHYTNDFSSPFVTFEQELNHTKNYLDMMSEYYESNFIYEISVNESVKSVKVPKMILQPLAENCFSHAFDQVMPPWRIKITAGRDRDGIYFKVSNNGTPFKDEDIAEIERRVSEYRKESLKSYKQMKFGGLGLVSTIIRMIVSYGDGVTYHIGNKNGESFVEVRLK